MTRHITTTLLIWVLLTAVGELLVVADLFPTNGSTEAGDFDSIFRTLLLLGVPVFTFVVSIVVYAFIGFRTKGVPTQDGPPMKGRGKAAPIWLAVTGVLGVAVMIFPGLTGLSDLQTAKGGYGWGDTESDLVIEATAQQFSWSFKYQDSGIELIGLNKELVLPEDRRVKFEMNSVDVIHSFWIPAFRMKIDAIPGRTTFVTVEPTELGRYQDDQAYRVQCAELCGLNHSNMFFPVRVVSEEEFATWVTDQTKSKGQ